MATANSLTAGDVAWRSIIARWPRTVFHHQADGPFPNSLFREISFESKDESDIRKYY